MHLNPEVSVGNSLNKIKRIKEYIDVHVTEDMVLSDIAEKFEISIYYLCHLFKRYTGYTFVQYVNYQRLHLARNYYESGMSLLEAASRSGFRNYSSFYRAYRKKFGTSPKNCYELKKKI